MSFLLLGQTDAGKSTIAGHVLYKCGFFREVDETKGKSKWSYLLDTCEEERESGKTKTHEFSFYDFTFNDKNFTLIDTPGHLLYIRTLIEALFSRKINTICLVISSIKDEFNLSFERGTVKEDLLLARSVGCSNLVVLWNKTDIENRDEEMEKSLNLYIKKLRFKNFKHYNVSGLKGENITQFLHFVKECEECEQSERCEDWKENKGNEKAIIVREEQFSKSIISLDTAFYIPKNSNIVISKGFLGILHHKSGEFEFEIKKMNKKLLIGDGLLKIDISLNKKINYKKGDKIIFRKDTYTIGYGCIMN